MPPRWPRLLAALALLSAAACSVSHDPGAEPAARRVALRPPAPPRASFPEAPPPALPPAPVVELPVYDLAADLELRENAAKDEVGKAVHTEVTHGVFLFITPRRGALAGAVSVANRALDAYFNGRFTTPPKRAISVFLFPNATSYQAWCTRHWKEPCDSPYGFYLARERSIIMNVGPGIGTLTHELVHPLVEADFPEAPDWINEGIASLFERFLLSRPGEIHGAKNWRHPRLILAWRSKTERDEARLPALFGMSDETFRDKKEDLHYAMARYLCQWLDAHGWLWPFYQKWRDSFASDPTGSQAFTSVVGKTPEAAHEQWQRWVRAL